MNNNFCKMYSMAQSFIRNGMKMRFISRQNIEEKF